MDVASCWTSHPHEWQPLFRELHAGHPQNTRVSAMTQYGGEQVLGITIGPTDESKARRCERRLLIAVPHAHEPACTAASVDLAHQLLTGRSLDGTPSPLDGHAILQRCIVTILPDTNAQGRARSPERCWDGLMYDNDAFLKWAFGIAADGERFGRYAEWSAGEHQPTRCGIEYEQVDDDLWVEPNTSRRSTHSRMIDHLFERYRYTHMLDLHQHENDEAALLPGDFEFLSEEAKAAIQTWGHALIHGWREAGATPRSEPTVPYRGGPRQQLFIDFWQGRCPGMLRLVSEVRNNRHNRTDEPTPMEYQFRMASAAIHATLAHVVPAN